MSEPEKDDSHVRASFDANIPPWVRGAVKTYILPVTLFFAGTGVTGATMFHSVSSDDVKTATKAAVTEAVSPVLERLDRLEQRQTQTEVARADDRKQIEELRVRVAKLPTRNR